MFKAIKDSKVIAVNESGEFHCLVYDTTEEDTEHTLQDYVHCDGEFVLTTSDPAIEQKKTEVRSIRNQYLYDTDKYLSVSDFPIDEESKEQYRLYRQYLRDYTETDGWYEQPPKDFSTWKEEQAIRESGAENGEG